MVDIHGLGAFGITPFLSEDLIKQVKYAQIKTRAGKMAYILSCSDKGKKPPQIKEGIHDARGALKWLGQEIEKLEE